MTRETEHRERARRWLEGHLRRVMDGPPAGGLLVAEVDNLADDFAEVERPLLARIEELQATVKRLNRRCQVAEAGVAAKFDSPLQEGRSTRRHRGRRPSPRRRG